MEPKVTLLLAKAREGFLNCHLIKNGSKGTKPAYKFMVSIPLLAIELKATPNGNPINDFYSKRKSSSFNVVQWHTTSKPIIHIFFFFSLRISDNINL